jgi:hypothetical protein
MKTIPGYPDYAIDQNSNVWSLRFNRKLKACDNRRGYLTVVLVRNKTYNSKSVHRLFAEAYLPNPNNLPCVNHINGIKSDNRLENLEWCTNSYNIKHAYDTGLKKPSVVRIVLDTATGVFYDSVTEAARLYNINMKTLHGYLSNKYPNKTTLIYA